MARRRHRMTPKRRAALKKAQAASARKRRRGRIGGTLRAVGSGAAVVGGTFVAYHANRYMVRPDQFIREASSAGKSVGRGVKAGNRKIRGRKTGEIKRSVKTVKRATDWSKFGYL